MPPSPLPPPIHSLSLQLPEWYAEKGIQFLTGTRVTAVDVKAKTLTTAAGGSITFDKLVVATGARVSESSVYSSV